MHGFNGLVFSRLGSSFFPAVGGGRDIEDFAVLGDGAAGAGDACFGHRMGQGVIRKGLFFVLLENQLKKQLF